MRNVMLSAIVAFLVSLLGFGNAEAQPRSPIKTEVLPPPSVAHRCEAGQNPEACKAAALTQRPMPQGPKAPTIVPMVCVWAAVPKPPPGSTHLTEVIWMEGSQSNFRTGRTIAYQRAGAVKVYDFPDDDRLAIVQACIPRAWLPTSGPFTLCNGVEPGQGGSASLIAAADRLRRDGRLEDFIPLLPPELLRKVNPNTRGAFEWHLRNLRR